MTTSDTIALIEAQQEHIEALLEALEEREEQINEADQLIANLRNQNGALKNRAMGKDTEAERRGIRMAAEVPLLWGRGDYSLGFRIHQHILTLIDEHHLGWGYHTLPKEKIQELIDKRGYVNPHLRLQKPTLRDLLWFWFKKIFYMRKK